MTWTDVLLAAAGRQVVDNDLFGIIPAPDMFLPVAVNVAR